jgi:hypothetical protein
MASPKRARLPERAAAQVVRQGDKGSAGPDVERDRRVQEHREQRV